MKKILIASLIFLFTGITFGQTLKKGVLISIHTITITLEEGVTMDQYLESLTVKMFPEIEKELSCEIKLVKGINRDIENKFGLCWYFKSKTEWNKFFNDDGSSTEAGQAAMSKLGPIMDELGKLGTWSSDNIVDWVVQ